MFKKLTPNLMVEDVERTIAFYRDLLGFEVVATVPDSAPYAWASVKRDEVELMFQSRPSLSEEIPALQSERIGASLTFYTAVTGLRELYERLRGQVEIVQDWHSTFYGQIEFAFRDVNGYILSLSEPTGDS